MPHPVGWYQRRLEGWSARFFGEEAAAVGVGDLVLEDPRIVAYSDAVSWVVAADGLLVLGVDDSAYMPSKLFLYALTGKPLLACMKWTSQVNSVFREFPDLGNAHPLPRTEGSGGG